MSQPSDSGSSRLGRRATGNDPNLPPLPTTASYSSASSKHFASPRTEITKGIVRRRKRPQPKSKVGSLDTDSVSDMDEDPEAAMSQDLQEDLGGEQESPGSSDTRSKTPVTSEIEIASETDAKLSEIDLKETTALKEQDGHNSDDKCSNSESEHDFAHLKQQADELAHKIVLKVKHMTWKVTHHNYLPDWLKDNDFLHYHHRPPLGSFRTCFRSIFRIHTETGNIWTHLLGCLAFIIIAIIFLVKSIMSREDWQEILAYMMFFLGAILCLGFSCLFHTLYCHSHKVARIFSKLDYSGITFLIIGSFVPWLYFGFYCENIARYTYLALIITLGVICLTVALHESFGKPKYRPLRAGLFIALGLSGVIPAIHYLSVNGFIMAIHGGGIGWMALMACLYIVGAVLYAVRVPERFFPGKCDIWFQSHQLFHVFVLAAAFVHYHGINTMAAYRDKIGECDAQLSTQEPATSENNPFTPVFN